jgi:hypothetical protein
MLAFFVQGGSPEKCLKHCFSTTSLCRTQDSPPRQRPTRILDDVLSHAPSSTSLRTSRCVILGGGGGGACEETGSPLTRHFRTPCASGCRGTATSAGRQYMRNFENGRKLSTKTETRMKITAPPAMLYGRSVKFSHVRLVKNIE